MMFTPPGQEKNLTDDFDLSGVWEQIKGSWKILSTNFFTEFENAYNQIETQIIDLSTQFGGGRGFADAIAQTMAQASVSVGELGGSLKDIADIQKGVVKALNTQTIINEEQYSKLYATAQLVSDGTKTSSESYKTLVKNFVDAGYGVYDISQQMEKVIMSAKEIGVVSSAVYSELSKNMGKLVLYNFDNGVQGMAKMAATAANMRMDMSKTLALAEDLFDPEKAIRLAGDFQRMGVQVTSLLDPYKLMDMARNDPAKLQESIIEMTKSLVYFDEKNRKMAILPGAQGHLRELGKLVNMTGEEMAKVALTAGDLDRKMRDIKFSPDVSETDRKMIANMAQIKDGKYVVEIKDKETGEYKSVQVSELNPEQIKELKLRNDDQQKSVEDLQREANGYLREIANSITARARGVVTRVAASQTAQVDLPKQLAQNMLPAVESMFEILGIERTKTGFVSSSGAKLGVDKVQELIGSMMRGELFTMNNNGGLTLDPTKTAGINLDFKSIGNKLESLPISMQKAYARRFKGQGKFDETMVGQVVNYLFGEGSNLNTNLKTKVTGGFQSGGLSIPKGTQFIPPSNNVVPGNNNTVPLGGGSNPGASLLKSQIPTEVIGFTKTATVQIQTLKEISKKPLEVILKLDPSLSIDIDATVKSSMYKWMKEQKDRGTLLGSGTPS